MNKIDFYIEVIGKFLKPEYELIELTKLVNDYCDPDQKVFGKVDPLKFSNLVDFIVEHKEEIYLGNGLNILAATQLLWEKREEYLNNESN